VTRSRPGEPPKPGLLFLGPLALLGVFGFHIDESTTLQFHPEVYAPARVAQWFRGNVESGIPECSKTTKLEPSALEINGSIRTKSSKELRLMERICIYGVKAQSEERAKVWSHRARKQRP
jgi:hypothetical protein